MSAAAVAGELAASILIPVWNEAALVGECIADVKAQVGVAFECVLALDGPTDGTAEVVRAAVAGDARFVVVAHPGGAHRGLVATLNVGLAACRAPIVVRMDADDRMREDRVRVQVEALAAAPDVGVVTCEVAYGVVGEPGTDTRTDGRERHAGQGMRRHCAWINTLRTHEALANARFVDAPVAHPAVAYRSEVVRAAGGYRDGDFAEDHDLWLCLFARGVRFGFAAREGASDDGRGGALVTWRDRPARATRADGRYGDEARRRLVHRHLVGSATGDGVAPGPLAHGRRARLWGAGEYGRWHGNHLVRAGVAVDDVIDIDPKKVGRTVMGGVPVVGPDALGAPDGRLVLVCVASPGARALIAAQLGAAGYVEGRDWLALQ